MTTNPSSRTGRIGVAGTQLTFEKLGWIFREQPIEDYGIDAHVEVVRDGTPTGKLIALQIKCGTSWFGESTDDGFVFRGEKRHLDYWQEHSLPVIVVLYEEDNGVAYWQIVNKGTVKSTGKGWKLTIPFKNKITNATLGEIEEISKKVSPSSEYTILELGDGSTGSAKRYSANILLGREYSKPEILSIVKGAIADIKFNEYYRNSITKKYWTGKEAQVIWLYLYLSLDDVGQTNWVCMAQWVSANHPREFSSIKIDGEYLDDGIIVKWNDNYLECAKLFSSWTLTKGSYLDAVHEISDVTKALISEAIEMTRAFEKGRLVEVEYIDLMKKLEAKINGLYSDSGNVGLAPFECKDFDESFQSLIAFAHNIVLPFSDRGLKTWEAQNRMYLVNQAITNYSKELLRLGFEFEKIR
ncbi:MAG: DUF4365 domain-containing protein [Cyanobacteria bacterium P01_A01_bin.37]